MQHNLVIVDVSSHPMSPNKDEIGTFLPTPRKLLIKLFWIFVIFVSSCLEAPDEATVFNDRVY